MLQITVRATVDSVLLGNTPNNMYEQLLLHRSWLPINNIRVEFEMRLGGRAPTTLHSRKSTCQL
jgi:hypothetical protein